MQQKHEGELLYLTGIRSLESFLRQPFSLNSENKYYWLWRFLANHLSAISFSVQFGSVTQSCLTLCDPVDYNMPGLPVNHQLHKFTHTHVHWVGDAIQSSHPMSSPSPPPLNFPSNGVFSNESVLHTRWTKYWSFSFSISPSNEYSRLISFRMDWLDILAVQGTLKSLLQHHSSTATIFGTQLSL